MSKKETKLAIPSGSQINELQERINTKYEDCFDKSYVIDIASDIESGLTLEEIEECLMGSDNCGDFRKCLEGKKYFPSKD